MKLFHHSRVHKKFIARGEGRTFYHLYIYLYAVFIAMLQAVLGMDILSQAKSGMGKTAVFVLATLQQIEPVDGQVRAPWEL